jgi:hypothetical protein
MVEGDAEVKSALVGVGGEVLFEVVQMGAELV